MQKYSKLLADFNKAFKLKEAQNLILKKYRGKLPAAGFCYIASEALYHMIGKQGKPCCASYVEDGQKKTHWWLEIDGEIIDPTSEQFTKEFPYELGRGKGFLTKQPSKRTKKLIKIINKEQNNE